MRGLSWLCAVLLALTPVAPAFAQEENAPKPAASKKKTRKKRTRSSKQKPKPAPAVEAPPAPEWEQVDPAEPPPAAVPVEEEGGPQWETEEEEEEKARAAKAQAQTQARARTAREKKQAEALEQARIGEAVKFRRTLMTVHQGLGIATWASLVGTTVLGQLQLNDKYRTGSANPDRFERLHFGLALGSTGLFAATGLMGLLAPRPYAARSGFNTVTLHRILLGIATAGMLAQVGLGLYTHTLEGSLDQRVMAQAHQILGYATLGALTVGAVVLVF